VQVEPGIDIAYVVAGQLGDSAEPVAQGAAVNMQCRRGFVIVAAAFEVVAERVHKIGVLVLVVIEQGAEPFADKIFHSARAMGGVDESVEAEFVIRRRSCRRGRVQPNIERALRFGEGGWKVAWAIAA
jgi:hypothetical protein